MTTTRTTSHALAALTTAAVATATLLSGMTTAAAAQPAPAQAPRTAGVSASLETNVPPTTAAGRSVSAKASRPRAHKKVVYLTFDDGPNRRYTPAVLAELKRHNAKATFFMIGSQARANPSLVRQVRAQGHAIGNHTDTHPWLTRLSPGAIGSQLRRADATLGRTRCMRPPGGFVNGSVRSVAKAGGKQVVMWTVDPADWARPGTARISGTILRNTRPGSIILMHDGGGPRDQSVAALRTVLPRLKAQGYRFETLPSCR